jgi:transcriptional regulator with XRE-family HTH domain
MNSAFYDHKKLEDARKLRGLSQLEVAELMEVNRISIIRAEAGTNASYTLLARLCKFYGIPMTNIVKPFPVLDPALVKNFATV